MNSKSKNLESEKLKTQAKENTNENKREKLSHTVKEENVINKVNAVDENLMPKLKMKSDIMFKAFFSRKNNEKFLESFLTAILGEQVIVEKVMHDSRLEQLSKKDKYGVLDLDVQRTNGEIINIEIQLKELKNIQKRTTFYGSKKITEQLNVGSEYDKIKNVIIIAILDYNFLSVEEYLNKTITVLKEHREIEINNEIQRIYIELPKFRKSNPDMNKLINQWLAFIDGESKERIEMAKKKNNLIKEADEMYNILTGDEEVKRLEWVEIMASMEEKQALKIAKEEGIEEREIEIVKKMLLKNMKIEDIMELTNLSKEEIEKIKELKK